MSLNGDNINNESENNSNSHIYEQSKEEKISQKNMKRIRDRLTKTDFEYIFNKKILSRNIYIKAQQINKNIDTTLEIF